METKTNEMLFNTNLFMSYLAYNTLLPFLYNSKCNMMKTTEDNSFQRSLLHNKKKNSYLIEERIKISEKTFSPKIIVSNNLDTDDIESLSINSTRKTLKNQEYSNAGLSGFPCVGSCFGNKTSNSGNSIGNGGKDNVINIDSCRKFRINNDNYNNITNNFKINRLNFNDMSNNESNNKNNIKNFNTNTELRLKEVLFEKNPTINTISTMTTNNMNLNSDSNNITQNLKACSQKATVNRADCIRKRIKTHFNQFLLKHINEIVHKFLPNLSFGKLSQRFIADVKIESNKKFFVLPLNQIFTINFSGSKNQTNNKQVCKEIYNSNNEELIKLLDEPYCNFFNDYLESDFYINDLKKFIKKEGEYYTSLFKKYSSELVDYYKKGIPYKRKIRSSNDIIDDLEQQEKNSGEKNDKNNDDDDSNCDSNDSVNNKTSDKIVVASTDPINYELLLNNSKINYKFKSSTCNYEDIKQRNIIVLNNDDYYQSRLSTKSNSMNNLSDNFKASTINLKSNSNSIDNSNSKNSNYTKNLKFPIGSNSNSNVII